MNLKAFKKEIETIDNEQLLTRYVASRYESSQNFLNAEWRKEALPFVEAIEAEVLKRMENKGGNK
jgi:hypothetical protein